jgi:antitoxin component YwqK of YwqJK toxin-antitoxin module
MEIFPGRFPYFFFINFVSGEVEGPMRLNYLFIGLILFSGSRLFAQEQEEKDERFTIDTPVTLDFEKEEEPIEKKKKKPKKKVFYGIKTKKGFTRKGFGDRVTYETFFLLKKPEKPLTFVRDIYWFDYRRKEIRKTSPTGFDAKNGVLLHGPYKKVMGNVTLGEGIFFKGMQHGRWLTYERDSVLKDKAKYYKGWPKESLVSYYDPHERKKMKEITPIEFGEKEGYYYRFYENGQMAVSGEYKWDQKVGDWTEYYPSNKRKKIITYPKEPFDKTIRPYIKVEWNDKGKEIYRNNKMN